MDQPATAHPATAREIIQEIVRNMREGLEPLHYSVLPPSVYHVYLHTDDLDRLRAIVPRIVEEARRALDAEVEKLNQASLAEKLKISRRHDPKIAVPDGGWQVQLLENTDDDVQPGDIAIHSELALPAKAEFGAGSMTKRIATRRMGGTESTRTRIEAAPQPASVPAVPAEAAPGAFATISYEDNGGRKSYAMTKDEIVVGRGGRDYWTDLKLDTLPDVSREHFRLRRDPASGKFFLKDLSRLGTTINGEKAPSSIEFVDGEKRDRNVEATVPPQARIGLAGVLTLEFRSGE
jgi:hypothetical protein